MRKFNWGQKMIFFAIIFMLMVIGLVAKMMGHAEQLVDENYYEKGLSYQTEIDAHENQDYIFKYQESLKLITFSSPDADSVILFAMRPSNQALDFSMKLIADGHKTFSYPTDDMDKGPWNIRIQWNSKSKTWIADQKIILP